MSGGRGVRGNREVSPLFLLRGGGGGRIANTSEATFKEGGSWGKHGFPHGSEPKASDAQARTSAGAITCSTGRLVSFFRRSTKSLRSQPDRSGPNVETMISST